MPNNLNGVYVSNVKLCNDGKYNELSADVDGDQLWVRVPHDFPIMQRGEVFVAAALLEAMVRNQPLIVEDSAPISPKLLNNLTELQNIYKCWNTDLSVIPIHANTDIPTSNAGSVGSFYSGGIDSSQTLVSHFDEINYLVYIRGFGEFLQDEEWNACIARNKAVAQSLDKTLLPVDSNIWPFFQKRQISVYFFHGLILGGLAGILGLEKMFIPSSHTYLELFPWGSHPVTDHLWGTEGTIIVHDSAQFSRTEKTAIVASMPKVLDNLQVCWMSNVHNCGTCSKCVRTRITLDLQGVESNNIPSLSSNRQLRVLDPDDESGLTFLEDIMLLAKRQGADAIYKTLRKGWRKYHRMQALALFDRVFLGGVLRRISHLKPAPWRKMRVLLTSKERVDF